jgi:ribonuclease HII
MLLLLGNSGWNTNIKRMTSEIQAGTGQAEESPIYPEHLNEPMQTLEDFNGTAEGGICGVDEAGRGPVIGPMVVVGLMVEDDKVLRDLGVKDSKKLTPGRREVLAEEIKAVARHETVIASADDIDTLRQRFTMNVMESKMFATVIERLGPKVAYVDAADANETEYRNLITCELSSPVRIISKHGADELYPVVSAASIIAKTKRDALIEEIREELGQDIGSGYPSDTKTIGFLKEWYAEHGDMPPHTRKSWKTVNRIIGELSATSLDRYGGD